MSFPKLEFPRNKVTSKTCFKDEDLLGSVHSQGNPDEFLPKVAETYGKIIFPYGKQFPYVFGSIALSMDGKMAYPDNLDGDMLVHSNTLNPDGALADFFILNFLRAYSDAVLIGTRSMKAEANEWITIYDDELILDRKAHFPEKEEQPFTIVSSKDGTDLPFDHLLFHQDKIPVLVFTSPEGYEHIHTHAGNDFYLLDQVTKQNIYKNPGKCPVVVSGEGCDTNLVEFFRKMKKAGINHIMIESPTMMWLLMKEKLLNEFFITYTSIFIGGKYSPGYFSAFTFDDHPQSRVAQMNHHGSSYFFTRQVLECEK